MDQPIFLAPSAQPEGDKRRFSDRVADARTALSAGEAQALRNLEQKRKGEVVDFMNIRDACSLTDLGFAVRTREGWEITASGRGRLSNHIPAHPQNASLLAFPQPSRRG